MNLLFSPFAQGRRVSRLPGCNHHSVYASHVLINAFRGALEAGVNFLVVVSRSLLQVPSLSRRQGTRFLIILVQQLGRGLFGTRALPFGELQSTNCWSPATLFWTTNCMWTRLTPRYIYILHRSPQSLFAVLQFLRGKRLS